MIKWISKSIVVWLILVSAQILLKFVSIEYNLFHYSAVSFITGIVAAIISVAIVERLNQYE